MAIALDEVLISTLSHDEEATYDVITSTSRRLFAGQSSHLFIAEPRETNLRLVATTGGTTPLPEVVEAASLIAPSFLSEKPPTIAIPLRNSTSRLIGMLLITLAGNIDVDHSSAVLEQSILLWRRHVVRGLEFLRLSCTYYNLRNAIKQAQTMPEMVNAILDAAMRVADSDRAEMSLFDPKRDELYVIGESSIYTTCTVSKQVKDESVIRQMFYSYRSSEILRSGPELFKSRGDERTCCQIILRWQFSGTALGFLSVESFESSYSGQEHKEELVVLLKAVEEYVKCYKKQPLLDGFGWPTTQHSYSLDTLLETVLTSLHDGYGFRHAILYTPEEPKRLRCRASLGCRLLPIPAQTFWYQFDDESAAAHVFNDTTNEVYISRAPWNDILFSRWGLTFFQILDAVLVTPMLYADRKVGVIVAWGSNQDLRLGDENLLISFANLAAAAIHNFDANLNRLETFHSLVEKLPLPVFRKDKNSKFTYANPEFCRDLRGSPPLSAVIGRGDHDFYPQADADKYVSDDRKVLDEGIFFEDAEINLGREVDVLKLPVRDTEGQIVELQCIYRPRRFRKIFERASQGIYQSTPDGRYLTANDALAKMLGYDNAEALTSHVNDIAQQVYWDPKDRESFKKEMQSQKVIHDFPYRARRTTPKGDEMIWLRETAKMITDPQQKVYYEGFVQDMTEQRRDEELRVRSEIQSIVGELAVTYGHHLGQPLVTAQNMVQSLLNSEEHNTAKLLAILERINGVLKGYGDFHSCAEMMKAWSSLT